MKEIILKLAFLTELYVAELIFLFPRPKRTYFWLRLVLFLLVGYGLVLVIPFGYGSFWSNLLLFVTVFTISVLTLWGPFRISFSELLASCTAGYAVEHIAFHVTKIARANGFMAGVESEIWDNRIVCEGILFPIIYALMGVSFGVWSAKNRSQRISNFRLDIVSIAIVFICIGLTRATDIFGDGESITVSIYAIVACLLALFIQVVLSHLMRQEQETQTVRLLWEEERKQFEVSKKTMEVMSIKYHDLKHRLRDMSLPPEEVESIKETMRVYGSKVKTGNEALDVLLSETNLACSNEGIILTYTGNGQDFSFMKVTDVYSLFGNAVSNAVEAVEKVEDPEKKVIDILSERKGEMIIVHVTNYCLGDVKFQNGLPRTTKQTEEGFHGYGMKSMQMIAHKYGGNIEARLDNDLFHLGIYLLAK